MRNQLERADVVVEEPFRAEGERVVEDRAVVVVPHRSSNTSAPAGIRSPA